MRYVDHQSVELTRNALWTELPRPGRVVQVKNDGSVYKYTATEFGHKLGTLFDRISWAVIPAREDGT